MAEEQRKKNIKVDTKCDYCDHKMKYYGANDFDGKIYRACETHKEDIQKLMQKDRDENSQAKS